MDYVATSSHFILRIYNRSDLLISASRKNTMASASGREIIVTVELELDDGMLVLNVSRGENPEDRVDQFMEANGLEADVRPILLDEVKRNLLDVA